MKLKDLDWVSLLGLGLVWALVLGGGWELEQWSAFVWELQWGAESEVELAVVLDLARVLVKVRSWAGESVSVLVEGLP